MLGLLSVATSKLLFAVDASLVQLLNLIPLLLLQWRTFAMLVLSALCSLAAWRLEVWRHGKAGRAAMEFFLGMPEQRKWLVLRSLCYYCFLLLYYAALQYAPNGIVTAMLYLAKPTGVAALGHVVLGEPIRAVLIVSFVLALVGRSV